MPYHVRIEVKGWHHDAIRLDLSSQELEDRILTPYYNGDPILIGGQTIGSQEIEKVRISHTEEPSDRILPGIRSENELSLVRTTIPPEWYVVEKGHDVTDTYITAPPGSMKQTNPAKELIQSTDSRKIFVVHGRNEQLRDSMFQFLRSIGLHPIEWSEAVASTGKGSPYVGEILDKAFEEAPAIVILLTPDDEGRLLLRFQGDTDPIHETQLTPQARLNVVFEAGMAMGRCSDRTVIVEVGTLRPFSDISGRFVIKLDNTMKKRQDLANRLEKAGCSVNTKGTDWHTCGDFSLENQGNKQSSAAVPPDIRLAENEQSLLELLSKAVGRGISAEFISKKLNLKLERTKYHLDRLKDSGLVACSPSFGKATTYHLSKEGRAFLIRTGLL